MSTKEEVLAVFSTIKDPELDLNLVELGLIYSVEPSSENLVHVKLTMTSPFCPFAPQILRESEEKLKQLPGVTEVKLELVWEPPWNPGLMSEEAKAKTGVDMYA